MKVKVSEISRYEGIADSHKTEHDFEKVIAVIVVTDGDDAHPNSVGSGMFMDYHAERVKAPPKDIAKAIGMAIGDIFSDTKPLLADVVQGMRAAISGEERPHTEVVESVGFTIHEDPAEKKNRVR